MAFSFSPSLGNDKVGIAFGRFDEFQMHGFEYGPIAVHYHLYGSSPFDDIPFDDTDEAFVGVCIYKDFDVHQVPEFFIGQSEYAILSG